MLGTDTMDQTIFSRTRALCAYNNNLPGKYEHNLIGQEWEDAQQPKNPTTESTKHVVTVKIKNGEVKVVLCPMHDTPGDFYANPTGEIIHMNEGKDTKSEKWHMYHHAQECVG